MIMKVMHCAMTGVLCSPVLLFQTLRAMSGHLLLPRVFCSSVGKRGRSLALVQNTYAISRRTFLSRHVKARLVEFNRRRRLDKTVYDKRRSSFLEWNFSSELYAFSARLGESVDMELLRRVFTDRSYTTFTLENQTSPSSSALLATERLRKMEQEITGQHVQPVASDFADEPSSTKIFDKDACNVSADNSELSERGRTIIERYSNGWVRATAPGVPEEGVMAVTAYLSSDEQLSKLAQEVGMRDLLLCANYPPSVSSYACCLRAFVGALSLNDDQHRADLFVRDFIVTPVCTAADWHLMWPIEDPETVLVDCATRCGRSTPEPRLLRLASPHTIMATFQVGFFVDRQLIGSAPGSSVEEARRLAARDSLDRLMGLHRRSFNVQRPIQVEHSPRFSFEQWMPFSRNASL